MRRWIYLAAALVATSASAQVLPCLDEATAYAAAPAQDAYDTLAECVGGVRLVGLGGEVPPAIPGLPPRTPTPGRNWMPVPWDVFAALRDAGVLTIDYKTIDVIGLNLDRLVLLKEPDIIIRATPMTLDLQNWGWLVPQVEELRNLTERLYLNLGEAIPAGGT